MDQARRIFERLTRLRPADATFTLVLPAARAALHREAESAQRSAR